MKTSVPGVSHQGELLRFPLTVLDHSQFEGKVMGVVFARRACPYSCIFPKLDLYLIQSGVVQHHEALLARWTKQHVLEAIYKPHFHGSAELLD